MRSVLYRGYSLVLCSAIGARIGTDVQLFAEPPAEHIRIIRVVTSGFSGNRTNVKTVICR